MAILFLRKRIDRKTFWTLRSSIVALAIILVASLILVRTVIALSSTSFIYGWATDFQTRWTPVAVTTQLAKGKLLVASRHLTDPNFAETVILLLDYAKEGAMGVILNRPTEVDLATVMPEIKALKKRKDIISLGGPVGRENVLLLVRSPHPLERAQQIFGDCYIIANQKVLTHLIGAGNPNLKLRAFVGYAGWAPSQLEAEVSRRDWHIVSADATTVFDTAADKMWPTLIKSSELEWASNNLPLQVSFVVESIATRLLSSWRITPDTTRFHRK